MTRFWRGAICIATVGLAMLAANAVPARSAGVAMPADPLTYTATRTEVFAPGWWANWGIPRPWNTDVKREGSNHFLRVTIRAARHDGTSFFLPVGGEAAHLRYKVRLGRTFDPTLARNDVKLPGFGNPSFDSSGRCSSACGGRPAAPLGTYSARAHVGSDRHAGSYVYDLAGGGHGYGRGERWAAPPLANGRWYVVDQYIRLNAPGSSDGSLVVHLDGRPVLVRDGLQLRAAPGGGVGYAWFNVHFGGRGRPLVDMKVDFDDVLLEWR